MGKTITLDKQDEEQLALLFDRYPDVKKTKDMVSRAFFLAAQGLYASDQFKKDSLLETDLLEQHEANASADAEIPEWHWKHINRGLEDAKNGRLIPHEQVKKDIHRMIEKIKHDHMDS